MPSPARHVLFGWELDALTLEELLSRCVLAIRTRERLLIGVVNAAKLCHARRDGELAASLAACDVLVADGQSVVWASRLLRRPLPERVAGIDLFERLLAEASVLRSRVFLLGAGPEVLAKVEQSVRDRFPGVVVAGARNGYFTDDEAADIAASIRDSRADMLFLGMSSPKKEVFLRHHGDTLGVPVLHGVGGSFDVLAGVIQRAPLRWQRLGLEWLYRVRQEPRRLWRRYLTTNVAFVGMVVREAVHQTPVREA